MVWPFGATGKAANGPDEPSQKTARNAIIAAALLIGALTLGAHGCSQNWTARSAMERYVKLGPRQGPEQLERDLLKAYPPGSGIGPLFSYLSQQGFDCGPALEPGRGGDCRLRARREDGRIATLLIGIAHDGVRVRGIAVRMTLGMG